MGYSCSFVDTRSGERLLDFAPSGGKWKTLVNAIGEAELSFNPYDESQADVPAATWQEVLQPWHRTLVVSYDGIAQYAGPLHRRRWQKDQRILTVRTREVRALMARRFASMLISYDPKRVVQLSQKSLRGIARWILSSAFVAQPGDNWTLPVMVGGDESGSATFETKINDFESFEAMLTRIQDTDGGPDIALHPVWSSEGRLQWWPAIGSPLVPGQSFEWNASAKSTPVSNVDDVLDGSLQLSGIFGLGEGSGQDMKVGRSPVSGIAGPPIPDMDGTRSFKSLKKVAELDARATAEVRAVRAPTSAYSFDLDIEAAVRDHGADLAQFRLGARTRVYDAGDKVLAAGWRGGYVTAIQGDVTTSRLAVEVQGT